MRGSTAGFTGNFATSLHSDSVLLQCADVLFASVVVTPVTLIYWWSTWNLLDLYLYPDDEFLSYVVSAALGMIGSVILCVFQFKLRGFISPDKGKVKYFVLSRLYSCVAGLSCIAAVRGVWDLMNMFGGEDLTEISWSTVASILSLAALRTLKNICAIPFVVVIDSPRDHFDVPTYFKKSAGETVSYFLDCVFSVLVVGTLVVGVWRGLWGLAEGLFFPDDNVISCCFSLVLGYGLVIATFALQEPVRWLASKLEGGTRLLLADVYNLVSFIATVNVWRGMWGLMDDYWFRDSPYITSWSCHVISTVVLIALNCFNTALVRGVYFDDEDPADEAVVFPCHYIRIYYHRRKMRKKFRQAVDAEKNTLADSNVPLQYDEKK